eukprot:CAMPEP_0168543252 /NCGR_PEP_ID=MMETSP0413-20121227/1785_1 /TAXON_ID=136452 /ORGANISM="Filamoeba nolandi, Strain NC-AS-23-1" /LENGTH=430 /DNA_ID=CAMNT_0008573189 /DNA_START=127 /DNA_END=1416 /DNA_ORIENTATION=-
MKYLKTSNKYLMFIDGTHGMIQGGLTLTTVMYKVDELSIPVAWIMHSGKSEEDYTVALKELCRMTKQLMHPAVIFLDFEQALRNALRTIFGSQMYGDFFHFMQANVHWLQRNGFSDRIGDIVLSLRILWNSPAAQFNSNLGLFRSIYEHSCAPYWDYFNNQWVSLTKPAFWAKYPRPDELPSGDNIIEAWHHRLKKLNNERSLSIPKLLLFLEQEAQYWVNALQHPHLSQDRIALSNIAKKYYYTKNVVLNDVDFSSVRIEELQELFPEIPAAASQPPLALPAPPSSSTELAEKADNPPAVESIVPSQGQDTQKGTRCVTLNCVGRANSDCTNKMCQSCCAKIPLNCAAGHHRIAKMKKHSHYKELQTTIEEAIQSKRMLWVRYGGGKRPAQVRAIKVQRWKDDAKSRLVVDDMTTTSAGKEEWSYAKTY